MHGIEEEEADRELENYLDGLGSEFVEDKNFESQEKIIIKALNSKNPVDEKAIDQITFSAMLNP